MNASTSWILLCCLLLSACAQSPISRVTDQGSWITPTQAVMMAADAAPKVVEGVFALTVKAGGRQREMLYLNSEFDYRDQRNLTIRIYPEAASKLQERVGGDPIQRLYDKAILVKGAAVRTKILLLDDAGKPTGKYYYQTHVIVRDDGQISLR